MATAVEYKHQGYNCAEAMVKACNDLYHMRIPSELASPFGGGMACGDTCGAVVGALMALGAARGRTDSAQKNGTRAPAAQLMKQLEEKYGSLDCRDLKRNRVSCDAIIEDAYAALEELLRRE